MTCNEIDRMLSDDWEGDEEIFLPEDEYSKPFNTPIILGCDKVAHKGPISPKEFSSWDEFIKIMEE